MLNKYAELRKKQREEVDALPIAFAFSNKQFEKIMDNWGLDPEKDCDKICKLATGGFCKKTDLQMILDTFVKHNRDLQAAIDGDKTGEGFIYEMFLCELDNHEFGYTQDTEETLDILGYTVDEVLNNPRLKKGLEKAVTEIFRRT